MEKRVLWIVPQFHNYYQEFKRQENKFGKNLKIETFLPKRKLLKKLLYSRFVTYPFIGKVIRFYQNMLVENMIKRIKNDKFDVVVIIRGEFYINKPDDFHNKQLSVFTQLKKIQKDARFVLYVWDSVKAFNFMPYLDFFDNVVTFDYQDSKDYGFDYHPLFYSDIYEKISIEKTEKDIDIFYLGSGHDYRYGILNKLATYCDNNNLVYDFNVFTKQQFKDKGIKCFTTPRPFELYRNVFSRSRAVLDIAPPVQTGLSIRIIEAVGAKKKIITTSKYVKNEDFYTPDNVFILGEDSLNDLGDFLNTEPIYLNTERYSISSFICDISNC